MTQINFRWYSIVGLIVCSVMLLIDTYYGVLSLMILCGIQHALMTKQESQLHQAKSESTIYKGIVYDQLRRYKEAISND